MSIHTERVTEICARELGAVCDELDQMLSHVRLCRKALSEMSQPRFPVASQTIQPSLFLAREVRRDGVPRSVYD